MPFLHHTGLTVADLERSLRFWRDAMGMDVLFQQEKDRGYLEAIVGEPGAHVRMAHLAFGGEGPRIELFQYLAPSGGQHRLRPAEPDEIASAVSYLVSAGNTYVTGQRMVVDGGLTVTF